MTGMVLTARERRVKWSLLSLVAALTLSVLLSVGVGPMSISMAQSYYAVLASIGVMVADVPAHMQLVVESIRLPRTVLGMLVGAALAVCGAAMQGLFRNPWLTRD